MGQLGKFGSLINFQVSSKKLLTMTELKRTVSGRWSTHTIPQKVPKAEFNGPDAAGVTCTVVLSAEHGIKPRAMIEKLEKIISSGKVAYLAIGGKVMGKHKMYIKSMSETWDEVWNKGELVRAKVNLTFQEYS